MKIPGWLRIRKKPVRSDYLYRNWEFKQSYPENDERAKTPGKELFDYENIMNFEELCIQSQFEDIQSWLDSQDMEFYESCEEDSESVGNSSEKSFYTCLDVRNCSTLKREFGCDNLEDMKEEVIKKESAKESYESCTEESQYCRQLRTKSKTIFKSL